MKIKKNKYWKEALKIIPGGNLLYSKRPEMFLPKKWPTYFLKSKDCYVWDLENKKFIDKESGEKIPEETIRLLKIQKDITIKQLIKYPKLYYVKSSFPLEVSQRAINYLWRMCESYELWSKESGNKELLPLNITE